MFKNWGGGGVIGFKETSPEGWFSQRRHGETRGGRVPPKTEIWGDVFYGWSLISIVEIDH